MEAPDQWLKEQKGNLLEGRQERVIEELKAHRSPVPLTGEAKSPVDRAHDYLEARVLQLDYTMHRHAPPTCPSEVEQSKASTVP